MVDFAVVGGGVGGVSIASLLSKNYSVKLFEKESYLGGCAGTFQRGKFKFNAGATTFVNYQKDMPIYNFFEKLNLKPKSIKKIDPSIRVFQKDKKIDRFSDLDRFIEEIDRVYPHKNNRAFWSEVKRLNEEFYRDYEYFFSKYPFSDYLKSLKSFLKYIKKFKLILIKNGRSVIEEYFPNIERDYLNFLDNQIIIVAQTKSERVNFLVVALALGYSFFDSYYKFGGVGEIVSEVATRVDSIELKSEILKIEREKSGYLLNSATNSFRAKNIILNRSIFNSKSLFQDTSIEEFFSKFKSEKFTISSAFTLYLVIESDREYMHHYQIIEDRNFSFSNSNSIFISISDRDDKVMTKSNHYSITISTHTLSKYWLNIPKSLYLEQKETLTDEILKSLYRYFPEFKDAKVKFAGTPKTFKRYVGREDVGGVALTRRDFPLSFPSNTTKFKNLYMIGDTIFPAQGFPAILMGAMHLERIIDERA